VNALAIFADHRTYTLEELCRTIWQQDERRFREIAKHSSFSLLIPQFERENASRKLRAV